MSAGPSLIPSGAKLDLGCGASKHGPEWIGVDRRALEGVDRVGDVFDVLSSVPDGWISEVFASHFLEHIDDAEALLAELARVLAPGGRLELVVPHFSNPHFWSDPTHRRSFGLYTLAYFTLRVPFRREVPVYGEPQPLELLSAHLRFRSSPPAPRTDRLLSLLGRAVNASTRTQELWEARLAWVVPCYEVAFALRRM